MAPHQNTDHPEDRVAETHESITARLEGAKAAQGQIRFTLGMMAVISMMMLIASYNAYLSYDYDWIIKSNDPPDNTAVKEMTFEPLQAALKEWPEVRYATKKNEADIPASVEVARTLKEQALKDWASSRIALISLLGIRVSVDDAAVLGTAILLILSVWLLLWARRENHTIGNLLRDTHKRRRDDNQVPSVTQSESQSKVYSSRERWLIFHSINSNSIFITAYSSFRSIDSLEGEIKKTASTGFKWWFNYVLFGLLRNFFSLFPVVAAFIVFALDRISYFMRDPFDENFHKPSIEWFFWWSLGWFLVCWSLLAFCCWRSRRYSLDTEEVLRQYEGKLKAERSAQEQPPQS